MGFPFDERRAGQAAAYLIERHGGTLNYMKLLKLLYLADRQALLELGAPLTGDGMYSMEYGPILSRVLDLLRRGGDPASVWAQYVSKRPGYDVSASKPPEMDEFSEVEIELLDRVDMRFGGMTEWELSKFTHKLPEFRDPGKSTLPIDLETILRSEGKTPEEIDRTLDDADDAEFFENLRLHQL